MIIGLSNHKKHTEKAMKPTKQSPVIEVTQDQLPMHCPAPGSALWDSHPRVFIPLDDANEASCSYCGTTYKLVENKNGSPVTKK